MSLQVADLWTAAGVLLGFQVTAFLSRLQREIAVGDESRVTWMPPSDWLNLGSMVVTTVGVFLAPLLNFANVAVAGRAFGLALLLFVGYPFALAGHYDMYNRERRSGLYCTPQERRAVIAVAVLAVVYIGISLIV